MLGVKILVVMVMLVSSGLVAPLSGPRISNRVSEFYLISSQGQVVVSGEIVNAVPPVGIVSASGGVVATAVGTNGIPVMSTGAGPMIFNGPDGPMLISGSSSQSQLSMGPFGSQIIVTGGESVVSGQIMSGIFPAPNLPPSFASTKVVSTLSTEPSPNYSPFSTVTAAIPGLWLDASKRRSRSQIYFEILELIKRGPMTPFEIAFYARLNHKRTKEYTEFLKRSGYLKSLEEDGRTTYVLTANGLAFIERVKSLFEENRTTTTTAEFPANFSP